MSKYNVGDKFIIEIDEVFKNDADDIIHEEEIYRIKGFRSLTFDDDGLDRLQKYNEPTISQDTLEMERMKALNEGRNEVWELVRRLYNTSLNEIKHIFGINDFNWDEREIIEVIVKQNTPQEALIKFEEYEKANVIKVGDVITRKRDNYTIVVCSISDVNYCGVSKDGMWTCFSRKELIEKGKHIDIQSILDSISK